MDGTEIMHSVKNLYYCDLFHILKYRIITSNAYLKSENIDLLAKSTAIALQKKKKTNNTAFIFFTITLNRNNNYYSLLCVYIIFYKLITKIKINGKRN